MQPIKLEIFLDDKTLAGMNSVESNIAAMEAVTRQVIENLKLQLKDLEKQYKVLQKQGLAGDRELADIQAMQGAIGGLKEQLKELQKVKQKTNETPIIDEQAVIKQTNSLKMQFSQVARELPSLAMGPQMFILAISNNLPYLADAIKDVRVQNEALSKSGQKATPVWKQLLSAAGSWQTMLVVGITLLTVYGKEIWEWTKGLLKAKDATLDLLTAEQEMAQARSKVTDSIKKEQAELDILYTKLRTTAASTKERTAAVNEWQKRYPEYANILNGENLNLSKLESSYKALSKEIYANAVARSYADKISDLSVKKEKEEVKRLNQKLTVAKAQQDYEKKIAEYNSKNEKGFGSATAKLDAEAGIENARRNVVDQQKIYDDLIKNIKTFDSNITTIENHIKTVDLFPQPKEGTFDYWTQQKDRAEGVLKEIKSSTKKTLDDASNSGKNLYSLGIDKSVVETYRQATKELKQAQKELKTYDTKEKKTKGKPLSDYENELADARLRTQQKIEATRTAIMNDGYLKRKAVANQEYKESLDIINKEERDALAKLKKAKKAGKKVTPEEEKQIKDDAQKARFLSQVKNLKDTADIEKEWRNKNAEAWIEYNKEYGTYQEKRLAIEKEYDLKIAGIQENRRKAQADGDAMVVEQMDIALAKATKDKGKALVTFDYDTLKQSPDYIRAFENLKHTSTETLNSLLLQFEKAKSTAAQVLSPDQLREYTTTIQEIMDELDNRNPFQTLVNRKRELAEAEEELAKAKRQLDAVNNGAKIETGIKNTKYNASTGKIDSEKTYLSAAQALEKYNAAKNQVQKANNNFVKSEKDAKEKVDELAEAIKGVGEAIGGTAGEIISLIGDVALFSTNMIDGITKVTETGTNAISAVEKASVILGIISTAIQLLQKMSDLGNNKAFKQYEAYAEKIKEINALTDAVNQYKIAALEAQNTEANWFSTDNLNNLRDYRKLHDEVSKAYADKAMESQAVYKNESGGGWLTGAINWVMGNMSALSWWDKWKDLWGQGDYDGGQTAAINNLRIETRKKSNGFLGTGIGGKSQKTEDLVTWARNQGFGELFDDEGMINKELAQSLIDNYGDKLVGQTKETLEQLIELRKKYDEYLEQLHEYVSSLYEPLVNNFVDSLWDWLDEGKDALSSFKSYASDTFRDIVSDMMRSIVLSKVIDGFDDQISDLYEQYAKGEIDEKELMKLVAEKTGELMDRYKNNLPTLEGILGTVNEYFKKQGIELAQPDVDASSQNGRSGAFTTISQEQGTKLEGLFTSLQDHASGMHQLLEELKQGHDADHEIFLQIAENTAYCRLLQNILELMEKQDRDGVKLNG